MVNEKRTPQLGNQIIAEDMGYTTEGSHPNEFIEHTGHGFADAIGPQETFIDGHGAERLTHMLDDSTPQPEILIPNYAPPSNISDPSPRNNRKRSTNSRTMPPSVKAQSRRSSEQVTPLMYPTFNDVQMIAGHFDNNTQPGEIYLEGNDSRLSDQLNNQEPIPYGATSAY